jgi:predicted MFS family arabinose efflux permease
MHGLASGTAACALAHGLPTLLAARVVAGAFGGPATALSYAIIADVFPPARRGRAMGAVMSAFSAASVLGVPAGLELARRGGWRTPFVAVGLLGAASALAAALALPPLRGHLAARRAGARGEPGLRALLARRLVRRSYAMSFVAMAGAFVLVPNLFAFLEYNLGYPRGRLGVLYLAGGAASFLAMRVVGRLIDRVGARATADAAGATRPRRPWRARRRCCRRR